MTTDIGTSTFTVKASDSASPATTATASLSILVNPPPGRNAALYSDGLITGVPLVQNGLQVQSNGSLTPLPSSPETSLTGEFYAASPTLPLLFQVNNKQAQIQSLLVNPDYSSVVSSSSGLFPTGGYFSPLVDPTGSNLYLPGPIDSNGTKGLTIFPGNGSLQPVGTLAIPNMDSNLVFTPKSALAFISSCDSSSTGKILSYSRASDGTLTAASTYTLPAGCGGILAASPDGRYLASSLNGFEVQVFSIAGDGTLTQILSQPFQVLLLPSDPPGDIGIDDMVWDASSSYLLLAAAQLIRPFSAGVAVLTFSGSSLTETVYPTGGIAGRIQTAGSFIYSMGRCPACLGGPGAPIVGFDFQNGQLVPLPGSPYPYGGGVEMVIY